jgi:DNA-binding NarL/FixJ family response regulator
MNVLNRCVLVVDDEPIIAELWCMHMEIIGVAVCGTAATAEAAIALAQRHRPAAVLMDVRLRGNQDGVDAALAIDRSVGSKIIFVTGSKDPETLARINLFHPTTTLFKPVSDRQLRLAVIRALQDSTLVALESWWMKSDAWYPSGRTARGPKAAAGWASRQPPSSTQSRLSICRSHMRYAKLVAGNRAAAKARSGTARHCGPSGVGKSYTFNGR